MKASEPHKGRRERKTKGTAYKYIWVLMVTFTITQKPIGEGDAAI